MTFQSSGSPEATEYERRVCVCVCVCVHVPVFMAVRDNVK